MASEIERETAEVRGVQESVLGEKEEWRKIPGFDEYEVSNFGRVRRTWMIGVETGGTVKNKYPMVSLPFGEGFPKIGSREGIQRFKNTRQKVGIHRLVALAFIGPCPEGKQVHHRDGNKRNPIARNLEYVSASENIKHAWATGLRKRLYGEEAPRSVLTNKERTKIVKLHRMRKKHGSTRYRYSTRGLAEMFQCSQTAIRYTLKNWRVL